MTSRKRGRKAKAEAPRIKELERENARLQRRLARVDHLDARDPKKSLRAPGDPPEPDRRRRERLIVAAEELAGRIGQTAEACEALGVSRSTLYRRRRPVTSKPKRRPRPQRALDTTERERVLSALHCERFVDKAPAQVWATLLDEGIYHCSADDVPDSVEHGEVVSAGTSAASELSEAGARGGSAEPGLVVGHNEAARPGQVDLLLPLRDSRHLLPVRDRVDVGSARKRRARPSSHQRELPQAEHRSRPAHLHADRGSSMRSKSVALLLADLGITKTHSRPYVSNDNPYSESQFKTEVLP